MIVPPLAWQNNTCKGAYHMRPIIIAKQTGIPLERE
jgi:hypothetical protein